MPSVQPGFAVTLTVVDYIQLTKQISSLTYFVRVECISSVTYNSYTTHISPVARHLVLLILVDVIVLQK